VSGEEQAAERIIVDIEPRQIVRWLLDEERSKAFDLLVTATRSYGREELAPREEKQLGEAEAEELSEINEVGPVGGRAPQRAEPLDFAPSRYRRHRSPHA
jgi:hypothetical protein